jgi:hypothetical protein
MFQNHCVPFPFRDVVLQSGVCVIAHLLASRSLGMRRRSTLLATVKPDDLSNLAPEVRLGLDTCPGFRLGHVAKRHGEISRLMFAGYQIDAITNGVQCGDLGIETLSVTLRPPHPRLATGQLRLELLSVIWNRLSNRYKRQAKAARYAGGLLQVHASEAISRALMERDLAPGLLSSDRRDVAVARL